MTLENTVKKIFQIYVIDKLFRTSILNSRRIKKHLTNTKRQIIFVLAFFLVNLQVSAQWIGNFSVIRRGKRETKQTKEFNRTGFYSYPFLNKNVSILKFKVLINQ